MYTADHGMRPVNARHRLQFGCNTWGNHAGCSMQYDRSISSHMPTGQAYCMSLF